MGQAKGISRRRFVGSALSAAAVAALPVDSMADAKMHKIGGREMTTLTPYLLFEGKCQPAMEFYKSCCGGELTASKVKDSPAKDFMPAFQHENRQCPAQKRQVGDFSVGLAPSCPNPNSRQHRLPLSEWGNIRGTENSI